MNPRTIARLLCALALVLVGASAFARGVGEVPIASSGDEVASTTAVTPVEIPDTAQVAVLAGGCFWGMEGVFEELKGVYDVVSGYSGGSAATAHYDLVSTGTTGHAESVKITFDPATISYRTLLDVYFRVAHDPTELNFQGPDHGTQYRSAIFYANDDQKQTAEAVIADLQAKKVYSEPIVTVLTTLEAFYPAEAYHQDFMRNNPTYPYIVFWDKPKIADLERTFPDLIAKAQ